MTRLEKINRVIKSHDRLLFAKRDGVRINIYRKCIGWDFVEVDGQEIGYTFDDPFLVMSLTDTWSVNGTPVEWGLDVIRNRLIAIDLWHSGMTANDLIEQNNKVDAATEKDHRNTIESFLYEYRSQFAKATDGINTSLLAKVDKRREKDAHYK